MHEVEWKKVFSGVLSEKPNEREETYEWVTDKFWQDEVLERLKVELEKGEKSKTEKVRIIEAIAAVGLEKASVVLAKKRSEFHQKMKQNVMDAPENVELVHLISCVDNALRTIIHKIKTKGDISMKNLVQKNFALK